MQDQYFESEISELRNGLREYKQIRKDFNAKISSIQKAQGVPDKTYPPSTYDNSLEQCQKNLKALGIDSSTASEICESKFGGQGTAVGNVKKQQEAAAQNAGKGIQHVTGARNASVQNVDEVPAWLKTHDYLFNKIEANFREEQLEQLKSAAVEDNKPAWLKTRSNLVDTMAAHREPEVKQVEPTPQIKSAAIETENSTTGEPHPYLKHISRLFKEDGFV